MLRGAYFAPFSSDDDGYSYAIHEAEVHGSPEAVAARSTFRWGNRGYDSYVEDEYFAGLTPAAGPVFTTAGGMRPDYTAGGLRARRATHRVRARSGRRHRRTRPQHRAADDGTGRRDASSVRIAGRFLAYREPDESFIDVYDTAAGAVAYRVDAPTRLSSCVPTVPWSPARCRRYTTARGP